MATIKKKSTPVAKKSAGKKVVVKKVTAPAKKAVAVKTVQKTSSAKKPLAKKTVTSKKTAPKNLAPLKKNAKPILKSSPAKKSAKPGAKKAEPKKLTNKKPIDKKPASAAKKTVEPVKNTVPLAKNTKAGKSETTAQKPAEKTASKTPVVNINDHQKELKKALSKANQNNLVKKKSDKPFVMPKTNTEKARKYEPQFIKSVLDQAPEENSGPSMRYSDNELNEFKELITRKLETAKKELGYLQGLITRKDEMGGDDTDNRYMTMEDGSLSMEREQLSQMASRQITFIDHLEKAMMRIENKTYGICRVTGKLIDKARLRAVPHATLSIEAKMGIAK